MFHSFLLVLVQDMLKSLKAEPEFFGLSAKKREEYLEAKRFPAAFKVYLAEVKGEDFLQDLEVLTLYLQGAKDLDLKGNAFFGALIGFFVGPFADKLDQLRSDFYTLAEADQKAVLDQLIKGSSSLGEELKKLLLFYSYQELTQAIYDLMRRVSSSPYVLVQSAREMEPSLKRELRQQFRDNPEKGSFPIFQVHRKLVGGLRVFQEGECVDHSWLHRVHRFTSLTAV